MKWLEKPRRLSVNIIHGISHPIFPVRVKRCFAAVKLLNWDMKLTWLRDKLLRSSRPFCFAFLFVFCSKLILFSLVEGDECRQIEFGDALSNSRLSTDHVIRVYLVQNEPSCRVKCFLDPDCVAYNYGKDYEGNLQCELCNKSHLQLPSNHVMVTPGFIFRPVAENPCITNPCPHSFTCQVGFRDQGYRCVSGM